MKLLPRWGTCPIGYEVFAIADQIWEDRILRRKSEYRAKMWVREILRQVNTQIKNKVFFRPDSVQYQVWLWKIKIRFGERWK